LSPILNTSIPTCPPTTCSCLIAAGLYMSQATRSGFLPCFLSISPSLPQVVVLPAPCSPTIIRTVGGLEENTILLLVFPISSVICSLTILITCCPGVRLSSTSWPIALSVTLLIKSLTTLKLTSASKRAIFTSLMASFTSFSFNLPAPLSFFRVCCSLSAKPSNAKCITSFFCLVQFSGIPIEFGRPMVAPTLRSPSII